MPLQTVPTAGPPNAAAAVLAGLRSALAGGDPIAPLPPDPTEASRTLAALRPAEAVTEPDSAAVIATSGSTGEPKGVVLSRAAITASATATHERLGGPGDWLLALPVHYVAGLMVLARTVVAGTGLHRVGSDLAGLGGALTGNAARRYLSIVPTQLVRALDDPRLTLALSRLDAVLLGGAPAAPALLDRAGAAGVTVITTYGMSETCGGCVYDGVPLVGVGVELDEAQRITLSGDSVFSGYRLQPELTAAALTSDADGTRRFRTQDRGRWADERLQVLGRFDDVVISGGLNVDLAEVERVARTLPDLAGHELAVIAVADAEWGVRVVAVTEDDLDRDALLTHLRPRLPEHALPRTVISRSLPRTSSGKIDRQRLIRDLTPAESTRAESIQARSDQSAGAR